MSENLKQFILERHKKAKKGYEGIFELGEWEGLHKTLSLFYPDNAHFVFELLQNAEDAKASKVRFELVDGSLIFKHNGTKDFNKDDIKSITGIGNSSKKEDTNTIGKFGVGFKSVFAYTTKPEIHSKSISFKIENLFIPSLIEPVLIDKGYTTTFIFPFDRDDKSKVDAFSEVKKLFDELSDNVLLFLTHIKSLEWQIANSITHKITKVINNEFVEIKNTQKETSQWLVFNKDFEYKETDKPLTLSIAFKFNKDENKIEPIRGDVSIFFPAKKETSKLKFHIDAPFSSTVARDSIVESTENDDIMADITTLCRESIHKIRDQGLLTLTFFEVLPNIKDELDTFYQPIIEGLVDEFNTIENKLIPLKDGSFGSIDKSIYCSKSVADIITDKNDMYILLSEKELDGLAINPGSDSRFKVFLSSLHDLIEYEDFEVFNSIYELASNVSNSNIDDQKHVAWGDIDDLNWALKRREWLEVKSNEYLQSIYAFLYDTIEHPARRLGITLDGENENYLELYHLIKFSTGKYNYGRLKCYFLEESSKSKADFNFVHLEVFSSGKNKKSQQKSKALLEKIGVENVDESTHIEHFFYNYKFVSQKAHIQDINRLVSWYLNEQKSSPNNEIDLAKIDLNNQSFVYSENNKLVKANETYIDEPYQSTGLRYISSFNENYALHPLYQKLENTLVFIEILTHLGSVTSLEIIKSHVHKNPDWLRMYREVRGEIETHTGIRQDWNIEHLSKILEFDENKFKVSLLIWNTISSQITVNQLSAKFQMSQSYNLALAKSSLIFDLMAYEWLPDKNGNFHKPEDINEEILAEEFSFDETSVWLNAVDFGKNSLIHKKEYKEKQAALKHWKISEGMAEDIKNSNLTDNEIRESIRQTEAKKLKDSMTSKADGGSTPEVAQPQDLGSIITNPEKHQENITKENKGVSGKKTEGTRKVSRQNPEQLKQIDNFLYNEYGGHCQICGDTFKGNKERNIFVTHSLNRSTKGDRLMSDVNRKGNSISLCPKHHLIFSLELQSFSFIEKLDHSELSLPSIKESFEFRDDVGRGENNEYDGFYNSPESSNFEKDVFMLPIKLFGNHFYLKFTQDHIQQFIEVWNNN